jgi:hypothetical protein
VTLKIDRLESQIIQSIESNKTKEPKQNSQNSQNRLMSHKEFQHNKTNQWKTVTQQKMKRKHNKRE